MIKDALGNNVFAGDLVMVNIGSQWVRGRVHKIHEGGVVVPLNKQQSGMTGDTITLHLDVGFADVGPGQNHPTLQRVVEFGKEKIVPIGD